MPFEEHSLYRGSGGFDLPESAKLGSNRLQFAGPGRRNLGVTPWVV
jgi:hypothetical protein